MSGAAGSRRCSSSSQLPGKQWVGARPPPPAGACSGRAGPRPAAARSWALPPAAVGRWSPCSGFRLLRRLPRACARRPALPQLLRPRHPLGTLGCCGRPDAHSKCTGYPHLIHVLVPPIRLWWHPRHPLPPQRHLAGSARPGGGSAAAASRCGGLSPSAWGKKRRRRGEPLPPAAPEPFAWRAGRSAGCSPRPVERLTWTPASKIYP
jgi:hypothetical protein